MKLKNRRIIAIIVIILTGIFILQLSGNIKKQEVEKEEYFEKSMLELIQGKDWFYETLNLLKENKIDMVIYSYSTNTQIELTNDIDILNENASKENYKKAKELKKMWYLFCDNLEQAYFNKDKNLIYKNELNKATEYLQKLIVIFEELESSYVN